jgi:hypothetical protein
MPVGAFRTALLTIVFALTLGAGEADARPKHKFRIKPYPSVIVAPVAPRSDYVLPTTPSNINKVTPLPNARATCGAPPCAGGTIRLSPNDIRNYQPRDIRSNQYQRE